MPETKFHLLIPVSKLKITKKKKTKKCSVILQKIKTP